MTSQRNFRTDSFVSGLGIKAPCLVATTANITLSGVQTVNGIALVAGDRCLVKDQTDPIENGIYSVEVTAWNRAGDFDGNRDVTTDSLVTVGVDGFDPLIYRVTSASPIVIGVSEIDFALFYGNLILEIAGDTIVGDDNSTTVLIYTDSNGDTQVLDPSFSRIIPITNDYTFVLGDKGDTVSRTGTFPVVLLAKLDGADAATAYTELARSEVSTFYGNAQLDDAQQAAGTTSLLLDGTTDAIQFGNDAGTATAYTIGATGDASIEAFIRFNTLPGVGETMVIVSNADTDVRSFTLDVYNDSGTYQLRARFGFDSPIPAATIVPSTGVWYHVGVERTGATKLTNLLFNGTLAGSITADSTPDDVTSGGPYMTIGAWDNAGTQVFTNEFDGWIDSVRFTNGLTRYPTGAYTPPDADYAIGVQVTIPAESSVDYRLGTFLGFNNDGTDNLIIAITTDTLTWAADNTTGTRTLAPGGYAVAQKVADGKWKIAGKQIT